VTVCSDRSTSFGAPILPVRSPRLLAAYRRGDQPSPASGRKPAIPLSGLALARSANPMATATYRCRRQVATPDTFGTEGQRTLEANTPEIVSSGTPAHRAISSPGGWDTANGFLLTGRVCGCYTPKTRRRAYAAA